LLDPLTLFLTHPVAVRLPHQLGSVSGAQPIFGAVAPIAPIWSDIRFGASAPSEPPRPHLKARGFLLIFHGSISQDSEPAGNPARFTF
jgi:hypothetical protein